jgi:shikimate dehydrogenase
MSISGKTQVCGIIGDPIEHTMSPVMHNAAFQKLGLDFVYLPFQVKKEALSRAVDGVRALNIKGLNVTIPHKVAIIPFLDKLDPLAEKIGAINTIASRAISFILAERGAHLVILNRQLARAEDLAQWITQVFEKDITALTLGEENLAKVLAKADILVNTTSVGMNPDIDKTPVPAGLLKPGLIVFDIVYNPVQTRLLKEAEAAGAKTINGLDMLVWQGAMAFEKWTGQKAPLDLMKREAIKALGHEN